MTRTDEQRRARDHVAAGLATAMLAGPWTKPAMTTRVKTALGKRTPPKWLPPLVDVVLDLYRDPPLDRPRELAAMLQTTEWWQVAWRTRRPPAIVSWTPVPTSVGPTPWPITLLPDRGALARLLDLDQGELDWFADVRSLERTVAEPLRHYRWTTLPKRDGVRVVAAPKPRLKEIQRRLLRHVFEPIPLHPAAHGCVRGHSVRTAITPHAGATTVIRADLDGFFPSIAAGRVWNLLRVAGLPEGVAHCVTGLVTTIAPPAVRALADPGQRDRLKTPHLPQGAPTSPAAANLVSFALDRRLAGLAERYDARYTRYVDDLTFSGGPGLRRARARFIATVDTIVRDEGFALNARKTVVLGDAGRQALLGAVVNHHPTLARPERDALRALLHNCEVHGWRSQVRAVVPSEDAFRDHVQGRIAWAAGLDDALGRRLRAQFDRIDWS